MRTPLATTNMAEESKLITGKELLAMGDIGPCELVEGRIVSMSPTKLRHGRLEYRLARMLGEFVEVNDLGEIFVGEVGIYVQRNPDTVRAADVPFISHERLAKATPDDFLDVAPELVIEIMSPSDRWSEVRRKLREYLAVGVTVVLVVEPDERIISAFRSLTDVQEFTAEDVLIVEDVLPGFQLPLADLFVSRQQE
jgi:Uma2 family endonuclease